MKLFKFLLLLFTISMNSQALPYHEIPEYPSDYSSGNIVARMIDGLGYRYYWATKDLTENDLNYRPSTDGRTVLETLQHLYGLSLTIVNAPMNEPNARPIDFSDYSYEDLRKMTLENLKKASELVVDKKAEDFEGYKVIFKRAEGAVEFPYWHMLNGPIADAIYHAGQIVLMRRASGNPIAPGVSVFMGKTKE
ncbi:DinB family protein [Croceivirga thetidis]|uniref:DinB family protein n=1 Tax=Croceivirga thetidis TaxID=2721623 RepID=A0ABX1GNC5_9FLAO|nr:DinB family protein [Croceivirga thetidis]NKI31427.1 DinB family protein [Croceivirga thetidis]